MIELVVGLALLGMALLGVAGLFIQASQSIGGARDTTEALEIAASILEEMARWSRRQTWSCFGGREGGGAFTVNSETDPCAGKWQPTIDSSLVRGSATILVEPLGGPTIGASPAIRITVRIDWRVKDRARWVCLSHVRS